MLTHIFKCLCWVNNTASPGMQEQLKEMTKQLQDATSQNLQRGKFSAILGYVFLSGRVLGFWPWNTSTSLTDNNALALRREISQLRAQLTTCSAAASAITGCEHPNSPSLLLQMTVCKKTKKTQHVELCLNPVRSLSYPAKWQDGSALKHTWQWLFSGLVHLNKDHVPLLLPCHTFGLTDACWSNVGVFVQF